MADSSFGLRDITLDINATITARVVRDALKNEMVKLTGLTISGTTGAGLGTIVIRGESATGPIFYQFGPTTNATEYHEEVTFEDPKPVYKGLYTDAINTAWAAGSVVILHTA
jgi:hypothetical protein